MSLQQADSSLQQSTTRPSAKAINSSDLLPRITILYHTMSLKNLASIHAIDTTRFISAPSANSSPATGSGISERLHRVWQEITMQIQLPQSCYNHRSRSHFHLDRVNQVEGFFDC